MNERLAKEIGSGLVWVALQLQLQLHGNKPMRVLVETRLELTASRSSKIEQVEPTSRLDTYTNIQCNGHLHKRLKSASSRARSELFGFELRASNANNGGSSTFDLVGLLRLVGPNSRRELAWPREFLSRVAGQRIECELELEFEAAIAIDSRFWRSVSLVTLDAELRGSLAHLVLGFRYSIFEIDSDHPECSPASSNSGD